MTSTLTRPLELQLADAADIQTVMGQHYSMWGVGLPKDLYYDLNAWQFHHPWGRRNYRYFVVRKDNKIVSSCKLYTLDFQAHSHSYKVAGIGAVFTPETARGHGYASQMLELVVKRCKQEDYDAVLLFSDIDPGFYENVGFELMPDDDFHIWVNTPQLESYIMSGAGFVEDIQAHDSDIAPLSDEMIPGLARHYRRYLQRQPYGIVRSESYFDFKVRRMLYRVGKVQDWPAPEVLSLNLDGNDGGYAIFEHSGKIIRVLEVVGNEETRDALWRNILRNALLRRVHLVRGWEAAAPSFRRNVLWTQRDDWSRPMLYPINDACDSWVDEDGCPLLEFDHF
jgi:GNAT superfamily N-acetyltransferase